MARTALSADAAALRRAIYDKEVSRADLVGLMTLGAQGRDEPEFIALVAEVARDVLPTEIAEEDADWLIASLGDGAGISCRAEFEVLRAALAMDAPVSLFVFAAREIERALLTGRRAPFGGEATEAGVVTPDDVAALRAILGAADGIVSRGVAEVLFDIAHATATEANDPAFAELFAAAVGVYVATASPDLRDHEVSDFLAARPGEFSRVAALRGADRMAEELYLQATLEAEERIEKAAKANAGEAQWVLAHLARGGELSAAEHRLATLLGARGAARLGRAA